MKKIDIYYNPYLKQARLVVGGNIFRQKNNRVYGFVEGKPMENWLDHQIISYQVWEGILPELMEELNDDELAITFWGLREDYERLMESAAKQESAVAEKGFDYGACRLSYQEKYNPEDVRRMLLIFLENKNKSSVGEQKSMYDLDFLGEELRTKKTVSVEGMNDVRGRLQKILQNIILYHEKEKASQISEEKKNREEKTIDFWEHSVWELDKIYS